MASFDQYDDPNDERLFRERELREAMQPGAPRAAPAERAPEEPREVPGTRDKILDQVQTVYQGASADAFDPSRVPGGVPTDWAQDFLRRNPGDYHRLESAYRSGNQPGGMQGSGGGGGGTSPYSATNPWIEDMRKILREQLGAMGQAPTVDDPGIREILAGRRLQTQRATERALSRNAERLAYEGLGDSGVADTTRLGLEQMRGEADASAVGDILGGELQQRRQALQSLLGMALASGDAESARELQNRIAEMGQQAQWDDLAYRYAALMAALNQSGAGALL